MPLGSLLGAMLVDTLYYFAVLLCGVRKSQNDYLDDLFLDNFTSTQQLHKIYIYKHETVIKFNQNEATKHIANLLHVCKVRIKLKDMDIHDHDIEHLIYSFVRDILSHLFLRWPHQNLYECYIFLPLLNLESNTIVAICPLAPNCSLPLLLSSRPLICYAISTRQ